MDPNLERVSASVHSAIDNEIKVDIIIAKIKISRIKCLTHLCDCTFLTITTLFFQCLFSLFISDNSSSDFRRGIPLATWPRQR